MSSRTRTLADLAFWPIAALGAALSAFLLLALAGVVSVAEAERARAPAGRVAAPSLPTREATPAPTPPAETTTAAKAVAATPPERVTVTVTAARGDSWIAARLDSADGRLLEERLLPQGGTTRFTGRRVWLLVGASANVDVLVNGKPRTLAPGTVETVLAPS
jgi:hypothetical protein